MNRDYHGPLIDRDELMRRSSWYNVATDRTENGVRSIHCAQDYEISSMEVIVEAEGKQE